MKLLPFVEDKFSRSTCSTPVALIRGTEVFLRVSDV